MVERFEYSMGLPFKSVAFLLVFSERTFLSLTKWMVSKGGGHVLEQHLGFADGYVFFG